MIQVPKFKFKSKGPGSKKNRWVNLCIDTTTGALIVGMFFFSRHLRQLMPGPPPQAIKFSAMADALNSKASGAATSISGLFGSKTSAPPSVVSAPSTLASGSSSNQSPADSSSTTASSAPASGSPAPGSLSMPVEIPGSSNNAESNLAGWIPNTSKPDSSQPANDFDSPSSTKTSKTSYGSTTMTFASAPAAKPAASLGDSLMSAMTPSASAETIQPDLSVTKNTPRSGTVPSARQVLQVQAATPHQPAAPLTEDQKLSLAAQTSFDYVIGMANDNRDIYGFSSTDKLGDARLADPIRVYTVKASDRKNYQSGQPLKPLLQPTDEWIFPVTLNNRVRFMVPVKRIDGEYVAGTSSRSLAIVYGKIQDRWPMTEGFHPQLVVNANMDNYYFTIPELPEANLTDTGEMFEFNPTLSPATVILASWR